MSTIYRKYRPATFADIAGQEHITQTIMNEIALGKVAHAYLFSGPRGVGKTTLARLLAKAVNCLDRKEGESEPCNKCSACVEIGAGRSIDVIEIDAASHTQVENIRENVIESAQFKPTKSKYKVFIIDEVHMLSNSSFNALLKTLEEPPAHVIFILATTELHKLPATVISRCQRFNFKKIPYDLMMERLKKICEEEKIKVDKEVLSRIINKSDGCLRDAESLLGQIFSLSTQGVKKIGTEEAQLILPSSSAETILDYLEQIVATDPASAIKLINTLSEDGVNLDQFAYDLIEVLRTLLIFEATNEISGVDYSEGALKRIRKLAQSLKGPALIKMIDAALKRRLEIKTAPIPQLPLELLAVEFSFSPAMSGTANPPPPASLREALRAGPPRPSGDLHPTTYQLPPTDSSSPQMPTAEQPTKTAGHRITDSIKNALAHIGKEEPITTTLIQIKGKWNEIVQKISESNHSLALILKVCEIKDLIGNNLVLTIPYSIHKERLEDHGNKRIIESILESIFSEKIHFTCEIVAQVSPAAPAIDLSGLAMEFGGEVVG